MSHVADEGGSCARVRKPMRNAQRPDSMFVASFWKYLMSARLDLYRRRKKYENSSTIATMERRGRNAMRKFVRSACFSFEASTIYARSPTPDRAMKTPKT